MLHVLGSRRLCWQPMEAHLYIVVENSSLGTGRVLTIPHMQHARFCSSAVCSVAWGNRDRSRFHLQELVKYLLDHRESKRAVEDVLGQKVRRRSLIFEIVYLLIVKCIKH